DRAIHVDAEQRSLSAYREWELLAVRDVVEPGRDVDRPLRRIDRERLRERAQRASTRAGATRRRRGIDVEIRKLARATRRHAYRGRRPCDECGGPATGGDHAEHSGEHPAPPRARSLDRGDDVTRACEPLTGLAAQAARDRVIPCEREIRPASARRWRRFL